MFPCTAQEDSSATFSFLSLKHFIVFFFLLFYSFHVENVMYSLLFYVCPRSPGLATTYNKWMVKEPLSDLGVSSLSQFQNGVV